MPQRLLWLAALATLAITACSDSGNSHNSGGGPTTPPPNTTTLTPTLTANEVVGGSSEAGTASLNLTVNLDDGSMSGTLTLASVMATAATIRAGFAGEQGPVVITLQQDSNTRWSVPAGAQLSMTDLDALQHGSLYAEVDTAAQPDGAIRAQLKSSDVTIVFVNLSDQQEVPLLTSSATATAAVTLERATGAITVHVNTTGLDDATMAHVHTAIAGFNGPVLIGLNQDPNDVKHWSSDGATLDANGLADFDAAGLYINVHTPAHPGGEVRGQIVPSDMAVLFVPMSGDQEVPPVTTTARAIAAITVDPTFDNPAIAVHVNTLGLDDATMAHVHQAPAGANGAVLIGLERDPDDVTHWFSAPDASLDANGVAAFNAGELYVNVHTPANPDGEVRGQIVPPILSPFSVTAVVPADGASLSAFPSQITVTFNRSIAAASATTNSVLLRAVSTAAAVTPTALSVDGSTLTIDLSGVSVADDTFQLTLKGTGSDVLTDSNGNVLDGDLDGSAGGDFSSTFIVASASMVTFQELQDTVFTPSCALSGCHTGPTPQQGMNLSAGQAYAAIVNVPSMEVPSLLRIKPNDPDNSYLLQKIAGTAAVGGRMPLGGPALPADRIEAIRQWISEGAPDAASNPAPPAPPGY